MTNNIPDDINNERLRSTELEEQENLDIILRHEFEITAAEDIGKVFSQDQKKKAQQEATASGLHLEFGDALGKNLFQDFADLLSSTLEKERTFAIADACDAVVAFEAVLKHRSSAPRSVIHLSCTAFAEAIYSTLTDHPIEVDYSRE